MTHRDDPGCAPYPLPKLEEPAEPGYPDRRSGETKQPRRRRANPPIEPRTSQTSEQGTIVGFIGRPGDIRRRREGDPEGLADRVVFRIITKADGMVILRERRIYRGHRLLSVERL